MTPEAARAAETLGVFVLAGMVIGQRRLFGSRDGSVRLRVPPVALAEEEWDRVARHILERRPRWSSVELVDLCGRVVATCERHAVEK